MADNVKVVKAKANGQPASLVGFTKAIYSVTEAGEVGERLDNTLANMQSQITQNVTQLQSSLSQVQAELQNKIDDLNDQISGLDSTSLNNRLTQAEADISQLKDALFTNITGNPFTAAFTSLAGFSVTAGVWNSAQKRLEC